MSELGDPDVSELHALAAKKSAEVRDVLTKVSLPKVAYFSCTLVGLLCRVLSTCLLPFYSSLLMSRVSMKVGARVSRRIVSIWLLCMSIVFWLLYSCHPSSYSTQLHSAFIPRVYSNCQGTKGGGGYHSRGRRRW